MRYPAPASSYSPERLALLKKYSEVVGVSDHTEGCIVAAEAVLKGAVIIEKHFTLDKSLPGADNAYSCEPHTFAILKSVMLEAFTLRAQGKTKQQDSAERIYARRAVYARTSIAPGEMFSEKNCVALRPAVKRYIPASSWGKLMGKPAKNAYTEGMGILNQELYKY
jgi:N-acetylneuraminate synthase